MADEVEVAAAATVVVVGSGAMEAAYGVEVAATSAAA